ncbi:MAG: hypothetical protein ACOX3T_01940 [Bdellovibrionota bacterium]
MNASLDMNQNVNGKFNKREFSRNRISSSAKTSRKKYNLNAIKDYNISFSQNYLNNFDIFHDFNNEDALNLANFFNEIIEINLIEQKVIYLENFGFLIPKKEWTLNCKEKESEKENEKETLVYFKEEEVLKIDFEKCLIINDYFKEKYSLIEFRDIIKNINFEHYDIFKNFELRDVLKYALAFINTLKDDVISNGVSRTLSIGTFYAVHNRQGESFYDNFAGADIIFKQEIKKVYNEKDTFKYYKPTLDDALEVFKAAYGDYVGVVEVNLRKELVVLGFSIEDIKSIKEAVLPLYVFEDRSLSQSGLITLYYATNTLRKYGIKEYGIGTEFVFGLTLDEKDFRNKDGSLNIPSYIGRAFTAAWLQLQREELRKEKGAFTLKYHKPLLIDGQKEMDAICISDFEKLSSMQTAKDGKFFYKNILGITADELVFANRFSVEYILTLLALRNLDQITRLNRRSIVEKTQRLK